MSGHSLRTKILLYSMIPTFLIGCAMAVFFSFKSYTQLNEDLITKGRTVVYPLSTTVSFAMTQNNLPLMQGLINEAYQNDSRNILAIAIFDKNNKMLVTSSITPETSLFKLSPEKNEYIYTSDSTEYTDDGLIMRMPIYVYDSSSLLTLYGYATNDQNNNSDDTPSIITDPKLQYPRQIAGYLCIYFLKGQTVINVITDISIAIVLLLLGLLISVLFGINLNRIIIDPINRLSYAIYEIREGNVNTKVNGDMCGELEKLRSYINSMASTMAEFHNEMQFSVDTATNDLRNTLDKLSDQNKQLELANIKAEDAAKIKNEFLANMSHELRTPLNGIIGFAKQLYKSELSKEQFEYLNTIERSATNLLSIVNNILDFTKLESSKLTLESIPFSIRKICFDTVNLLSTQAHQKGVELTVTIDPLVHDLVQGDPIRLGQILTNLLGNALKFTQKGNVALEVSFKEHINLPFNKTNLQFKIKDTGIGIDPEQQKQLFTPFTQADSSIARKYGGTGLGLVITKHLIEQMEGTIQLSSTVGQGTTFLFNIITNKCLQPIETIKSKFMALSHKKIAIVEVNTWVRDSLCAIAEEWDMEVFPMSNLQPINSLAEKNNLDYVLVGLSKDFDFNHLLYDFSSIQIKQVKRFIFAMNSLDHNRKIIDLSPQAIVISKPVFPEKLFEAITDNTFLAKQHLNTSHEVTTTNIITNSNKDKLLKASILAVDDNEANLLLIKSLLEEIVANVYVASSGQEAIELCLHTEFDLIFMDIQMPILDGITTMKAIRENETNKGTPVVAVTALVIKEEQDRFIKEGMCEFLSKPLEEEQLIHIVQKYCSKDFPIGLIQPPKLSINKTNDNQLWSLEKALKQTGGRKELACEMLNMFIKSIPEVKNTLIKRNSYKPLELAPIVHKFAGGSVYCGITEIKKLCNIIEKGLRGKGEIDDFEPEFLELEDLIQIVEQNYKDWLLKINNK